MSIFTTPATIAVGALKEGDVIGLPIALPRRANLPSVAANRPLKVLKAAEGHGQIILSLRVEYRQGPAVRTVALSPSTLVKIVV